MKEFLKLTRNKYENETKNETLNSVQKIVSTIEQRINDFSGIEQVFPIIYNFMYQQRYTFDYMHRAKFYLEFVKLYEDLIIAYNVVHRKYENSGSQVSNRFSYNKVVMSIQNFLDPFSKEFKNRLENFKIRFYEVKYYREKIANLSSILISEDFMDLIKQQVVGFQLLNFYIETETLTRLGFDNTSKATVEENLKFTMKDLDILNFLKRDTKNVELKNFLVNLIDTYEYVSIIELLLKHLIDFKIMENNVMGNLSKIQKN